MLHFVGVVRRHMDARHVSTAKVIYGNGSPDGLNGVNLWVLFMSAIGAVGRADVLNLFVWMVGGRDVWRQSRS